MKKEASFLVIGSNSFSGSNFIAFLAKQGYKSHGVSRSQELATPFLAYKWINDINDKFSFKQYDINKDLKELINFIKKNEFTHIVNFAAQSMVGQSWLYPEDWYKTNLFSLSKLVNGIKDFEFIERYISVTTPESYGSTDGWIEENYNFSPSTPYAISRAAQDLHLKAYYENFGFPVIFTRAANVYGEGQSLYRIIPRTIIEFLTNGQLILDGGGKSERSFIHINDVSDATLKIALDGKIGSQYHISTEDSLKIVDLVGLISRQCNIDKNKYVKYGPEREGKDAAYLLNSQKLRTELSWKDEVSLEDGLSKTIKWVEDNLDFLRNYSKDYKHKK